jgi:hypothetical protein
MAVEEVEHLVEEKQRRPARCLDDRSDRLSSRGRRFRLLSEGIDAAIARELSCNVNPRCLATGFGIPGIADDDRDLGRGNLGKAGFGKQALNIWVAGDFLAVAGEMIKRRECMGLAATELRDEREDGRRILRLRRGVGVPSPCAREGRA